MARAAAKRNQRPKQAARPQPSRRVQRANRPVEQTLFFTRLRRQTKWVFALLALVFAGGFVFFGVGSGSTGIGDLLQGNFGSLFGHGSSGPSISKAQKRIEANPKDAAAYLDLAQAYTAKKQDISAISAYESYVKLRPRDITALSQLVALYENQAQLYGAAAQEVLQSSQSTGLAPSFGPPASSPLGRALSSPLQTATPSPDTSAQYQQLLTRYGQAVQNVENTYRRLAAADPADPSRLIQYGQAALQAGDTPTAVSVYKRFLKKFPDDPSAPAIRQELKRLTGRSSSTG